MVTTIRKIVKFTCRNKCFGSDNVMNVSRMNPDNDKVGFDIVDNVVRT